MVVVTQRPAIRKNQNTSKRRSLLNETHSFKPSANVIKTENAYVLHLAVPGLNRDQMTIQIEDDLITIESEKDSKEVTYVRKEFDFNGFKRSFMLPENSDREAIEAKVNNGILEITIPMVVPEGPKVIQVK